MGLPNLHLLGQTNWVRQLNAKRANRLQQIFDQIDWDAG